MPIMPAVLLLALLDGPMTDADILHTRSVFRDRVIMLTRAYASQAGPIFRPRGQVSGRLADYVAAAPADDPVFLELAYLSYPGDYAARAITDVELTARIDDVWVQVAQEHHTP